MEEVGGQKRKRDEQTRLRSLGALQHMLPVLAFVYAMAAALFLVVPPFIPNEPHVLICGLSSAFVLLTWAGMRVDDPRFDTPISLTTISIAAGMGLTMFAVSGSISNTTTLAIAIVAAGALLYRFSMFGMMVVIVFMGWIPLAWGHAKGQVSLGLFHLWAATVVGGLVLWSRRELMFTLHEGAQEAESMRRLATAQARSLERARDAALASAQAKGQFLANVSHEVRTPLNGILGLLQLIDLDRLSQRQGEYLREVHKSARSLLAIVNDLLDLSKIEAGEMRLESVPFDIAAIMEEVTVNYASAAQAKGIEIFSDIDPDLPPEVYGDPLRLRQVVSNLVNNAIKFTHRGEVVVEVRLRAKRSTDVTLDVRVSDTGVGISKDRTEAIFRPFIQADASTTREYGGTGLGLPICRQLVELMGGQLRVESRPNRGSTFSFSVRFELEEHLSAGLEAVTQALAGMRVLVLEGNNRARETLIGQLESWSMDPMSSANFDGAIQAWRAPPFPDVALIDLRSLGAEWRFRLTELSKAAERRGSAIVAICSNKHEVGELRSNHKLVHVEKPIRRAKIVEALLSALDRGGAPRAIPDYGIRPSIPAPGRRELSANGLRVLVAEDNAINQKVVMAHLRALGYDVDLVADGAAALDALAGNHSYAAVIMDGQMPRLDGYAATRAQRAREQQNGSHRVPIIALTAHAMTGDRGTALAAGMDDYLTKPFTQEQLEKVLLRWARTPPSNTDGPTETLDVAITSQLLELEEEQPGFLTEVIESFFVTAEESIMHMRRAIESGDANALRSAAHMVRGSSEQLGACRFGATCARLENIDAPSNAVPLVLELERDLERAREALTSLADRALDAAS